MEFYTKKLGFQLGFTWGEPPEMAGANLAEVQLFLQRGVSSPDGCSVYFVVETPTNSSTTNERTESKCWRRLETGPTGSVITEFAI